MTAPLRNHSVDTLKLVCALLVVFIHCSYPYKPAVLPAADVAVPLFFAASGYFIAGARRSWKRVGRIAKIFFWSSCLYLLKTETVHFLSAHSLWVPTWKNIADLVLFNDVAFSIHLWYLPAYMYVLVAAFFIDKCNAWRQATWAAVPLLLAGVFIKCRIADSCPHEIQLYRNAYFCGLPYFLVGACVKYPPPHCKKTCCRENAAEGNALLSGGGAAWPEVLLRRTRICMAGAEGTGPVAAHLLHHAPHCRRPAKGRHRPFGSRAQPLALHLHIPYTHHAGV